MLVAAVAATIDAFWLLLGYRYSPESYNSYAITPGTVEFVWIGLALVAAVVTLVLLFLKRNRWPACVKSILPLAIVSLVILAKSFFHGPLRCYDMILFCTACGWGVVLWMKKTPLLLGTGWEDESEPTRMAAMVVWAFVLFLGAYYVWQQIYYWKNLALGYADCGVEASILYNTVSHPHDLFLRMSPDHPIVWGHFCPGVLAFVPLWMLWPDFKLIIVLEVVVIVGVAVPLYWIGKELFKETFAALLLVLAWLAYPSTSQYIYSASYGFRMGNVCLPLYFVALLFWMKGRKGWALAAAIGALSMKEEAAIIIGMFGLYLAVFERRRKLGLTITGVAFVYFVVMVGLVIPRLDMGFYRQIGFFDELGQSMWQILLSPLMKPRVFWGKLFEPRSWYFAAVLLAPLLFLPLKKPSILFVGLLTFVFDCMHPNLKSISYQYQAALLPVTFWGLAAVLKHGKTLQRRAVLTGVVTSGVMLSLFLGNTFWSKETLSIPLSPGRLALARRVGREIRESDSLFATQRIAAHFIKQRFLCTGPYTHDRITAENDYVLLDLQDLWLSAVDLSRLKRLRDLQRQAEAVPGLHLVAAEDGMLLYGRRDLALDAQHRVECDPLPPSLTRQPVQLGYGIRIESFTLGRVPSLDDPASDVVRVRTYSTLDSPTNTDLVVQCAVQIGEGAQESDSYASPFQPLGQGIWPIAQWETNRFYVDEFSITVPKGISSRIRRVAFEALPLLP
jgi:uncharacterized membrane protein